MCDMVFQFSLIAAYLDPRDEAEWVRLADLSVEQFDVSQAIKCYSNGKVQILPKITPDKVLFQQKSIIA